MEEGGREAFNDRLAFQAAEAAEVNKDFSCVSVSKTFFLPRYINPFGPGAECAGSSA